MALLAIKAEEVAQVVASIVVTSAHRTTFNDTFLLLSLQHISDDYGKVHNERNNTYYENFTTFIHHIIFFNLSFFTYWINVFKNAKFCEI